MAMGPYAFGEWVQSDALAEVRAPWDGRVLGTVGQAGWGHADRALAFAVEGRARLRAQSTGRRREVLERVASGLRARAEAFAQAICHQAGKPIGLARFEVSRAIDTFTLAAGWLASFGGHTPPVDTLAHTQGLECETRRFPAGVIVGVVPFNFPLNLGVHKVAPALAVGAPIVIKPPPQAPAPLLMLAEVVEEAGADPAALQVLPSANEVAERLARDPRVRVLSFTGSARVGQLLKAKASGRVVLELGGNAAGIVAADADLKWAARRLATSAFAYAGQVCIKVQRLLVEAAVFDAFAAEFAAATAALGVGDPAAETTVVGPVIDDAAAQRIEAWVKEAGGEVGRKGRLLEPVVLTRAPRDSRASREEVFGPVVTLDRVADFDEALERANDSAFGLQAGVFTKDLYRARRAFHELEVGGVVLNDAPSLRSDNQPYGGVKGSGFGREGIRYAMEDFTEERALLTVRYPP